MNENDIAYTIIGAAIEVHRSLGPGLLESTYHRCLECELSNRSVFFESEVPLSIEYKGVIITNAYRSDMLVENKVIVELKTVENINNLHKAQLLTYLRLSNRKLGLLINFNTCVLKDGISRIVHNL
ncbi:MAG: GxxExxY protein [Gammaproteobacteria bacterium]|nr:MAG: GxxExxY protein [Gammaproteobacteria bacterium]